jgi:uncharacterized membrane protein (UPF0127 family)
MKRYSILLLFVLLLVPGAVAAQGLLSKFDKGELAIVTAGGKHEFTVELALTTAQHQQGLMFRREMARDAGMLFDFGPRLRRASMWMKNTYIPLDMLFIKPDGLIESIAERTTPHSLDAISSRGKVRYVLEVNGGTAARLGISPGDHVELPGKN